MKRYWEQLTSQERRVVAVVVLVVFILFNLWFVRPHFHDVALAEARKAKAEETLRLYQKELSKKATYQEQINRLLEGAEADVEFEDQSQKFVVNYTQRASDAGVLIVNGGGRPHFSTNEFFLEQEIGIGTSSMESNLVNFLYSLGSGNSLMRVKNMNLRPDQPHQQLLATLTLVASYQRKAPAKSLTARTSATGAADKTAAKPVTPSTAKPAVTNKPAGNTATNKTGVIPPKAGVVTPPTNRPSALIAKPANTNKPASSTTKK